MNINIANHNFNVFCFYSLQGGGQGNYGLHNSTLLRMFLNRLVRAYLHMYLSLYIY